MPIYEFYCSRCNTVYNFYSKKVDTRRRPGCPGCRKGKLDRMLSVFAMTGKSAEPGPGSDLPIDEAKMERAISSLASEAGKIKEDDPRQAAKLMRKFSDMTGLELGAGLKNAMNRLEAGEDPEKIEAEMGGLGNGEEEPFILPDRRVNKGSKKLPPKRDKTLYEM